MLKDKQPPLPGRTSDPLSALGGVLASPLGPILGGLIAHFVLDLPYPSTEFTMWVLGPCIFGLGVIFGATSGKSDSS